MTDHTTVAVHGASGRMGAAVMHAAVTSPRVKLVAALVRPDSLHASQPIISLHATAAASLCFSESLKVPAEVLIDFSSASAFDRALALALDRKLGFVSGTTGLSDTQQAALRQAAQTIPVLWASNFSLGVALLNRLVGEAARALPDWDCEISEAHHRHKQDAPSGTALSLGHAIAAARDGNLDEIAAYVREGQSGARRPGEIGFSVVRGGDIVGEHSVLLIGEGERVELTHRAQSRDIFAVGAVRAATWLAGRSAGFYSIGDVLGLST